MNRLQAFLFVCRCLAGPNRPGRQARALREELKAGGVDPTRVAEMASRHFVTQTLYWTLREKDLLDALPPDFLQYLETMYDLNRERNLRLVEQTAEMAGLLNKAGVEPLVLKGMGNILAGLYEDPAVRFLADLDVLVPEDRLSDCVDALALAGYELCAKQAQDRFSPMADLVHVHYVPLWRKGRAAQVDIHRAVTDFAEKRQFLLAEHVLNDSRRIDLNGHTLRVPSALHRTMNNIAHTQLHHRAYWVGHVRPRDLYDLLLLSGLPGETVDWSLVLDQFERAGYGNAPRSSLMMVERLFGRPGPKEVELPPGARRRWHQAMILVRWPRLLALKAVAVEEVLAVRRGFSGTAGGNHTRKKLAVPSWYVHHARRLFVLYRKAKEHF